MATVTLAGGKKVNVDPSNAGAVADQAVAASRQQAIASGNTFGYSDEVALRGAINSAANQSGPVAPTEFSYFGTGGNSVTGQLGMDFNAGLGEAGSNPTQFSSDLGKVFTEDVKPIFAAASNGLKSLGNDVTNAVGLPNVGTDILILAGIIAILATAYIVHELL